MRACLPDPGWKVSELIERHPAAAVIFSRHQMACVGCAMAPFETLEEAATAYRLKPDTLVREFRHACMANRKGRDDRRGD